MNRPARLGLATDRRDHAPTPAGPAIVAGLHAAGLRVQHFRARACPSSVGLDLEGLLTGRPGRHVDPWLMPARVCRDVFERGSRQAGLSIVEGSFGWPGEPGAGRHGLRPLAEALDLPVVAVVPCRGWDGFAIPPLPPGVDAVILDGLERADDLDAVRRLFAVLRGLPVLGAVGTLSGLREQIARGGFSAADAAELIEPLARSFLQTADLGAIRSLATSRPALRPARRRPTPTHAPFVVAYADDEALGGYFPETLEALEDAGAVLVEFSPLRHERLPQATELVLLGCGRPEQHHAALSANLCLVNAIRRHVSEGKRLYAEGGGAAYLCRRMLVGGRLLDGADVLPFDADFRAGGRPPAPDRCVTARDSWLAPAGTRIRGYRSGRWSFRPSPEPGGRGGQSGALAVGGGLVYHHHAIGSLLHLHPSAIPELLEAWTRPHRPSLALPRTRTR